MLQTTSGRIEMVSIDLLKLAYLSPLVKTSDGALQDPTSTSPDVSQQDPLPESLGISTRTLPTRKASSLRRNPRRRVTFNRNQIWYIKNKLICVYISFFYLIFWMYANISEYMLICFYLNVCFSLCLFFLIYMFYMFVCAFELAQISIHLNNGLYFVCISF